MTDIDIPFNSFIRLSERGEWTYAIFIPNNDGKPNANTGKIKGDVVQFGSYDKDISLSEALVIIASNKDDDYYVFPPKGTTELIECVFNKTGFLRGRKIIKLP